MQKLDFTDSIETLRSILKCDEIVAFYEGLHPSSSVNTSPLTPLIIESKSNYDKIPQDSSLNKIVQTLNGHNIYSEKSIGDLINSTVQITVSGQKKVNLFLNQKILDFYHFHYTIIKASELSTHILFDDNQLANIKSDDTIIFRVLVGEDYLELSAYGKIFTLIKELIDLINKIISPDDEIISQITLLDSGSDANIGIKSSLEIATALFQIFKEVWDWVLNRKFYKSKLRNAAFLDNLNVMVAIKDAENNDAIDSDTAKIYRETLIRRTEDLLELKVLPKELVESKTEISSKKVLSEYSEIKMLESGENND